VEITLNNMTNKIKKRYNRVARVYDFLDKPMEMFVSKWRQKLLTEAEGNVLEVGIGTGRNIPYYPEEVDVTGIDFSENMVEIARRKAGQHPNVQVVLMDAEQMDFDANQFDTVITSCVFCSVPDPVRGLKEIRRVCKNGGKILMLEHVRSEKKVVGELMDVFNFIPLHLYGANINRRTYKNLLKAGFNPQHISVKNLWFDIVKFIEIENFK
jgi:ubiquinone/menaquinone biosynthesis C-methylase UbiE